MHVLKQNSNKKAKVKNNLTENGSSFNQWLTCVIHDSLISIIIGWKSFLTSFFFYLLYLFRRYWKNPHSDTFWILFYERRKVYIYEIGDALLKKDSDPFVCQSQTCICLGIPLTSLFLLLPDWGGWLPFPHSLSADFSPQDYTT